MLFERIRSLGPEGTHRAFEVEQTDLPSNAVQEDAPATCIVFAADRAAIDKVSNRIHIVSDVLTDRQADAIFIKFGGTSIAVDYDTLQLNLLHAQTVAVVFVHPDGWTSVGFAVSPDDKRNILAAFFGSKVFGGWLSVEAAAPQICSLDVRVGSLGRASNGI